MGGVDEGPDRETSESPTEAERVIRHRMRAHQAALEIAEQVDRPELLAEKVEETAHRLAEDEDILEQIRRETGDS